MGPFSPQKPVSMPAASSAVILFYRASPAGIHRVHTVPENRLKKYLHL
jgi:hypothetical protein